ncbi:hypothetical protein HUJ04_000474 [Dendroctonus ponderosae]|nr:hypothetical protein HUJ04_000474 [Dendroctonus ponderosae]
MDLQSITYEKNINHAKFLKKALETGGKSRERHLAKKMILRIGTCNIQGISTKKYDKSTNIDGRSSVGHVQEEGPRHKRETWVYPYTLGSSKRRERSQRSVGWHAGDGQNALSGWCKHKDRHCFTWLQPTRNLKSISDYIIVKQQRKQRKLKVNDVRAMKGLECDTDHSLWR